jgi:hypothetical protein
LREPPKRRSPGLKSPAVSGAPIVDLKQRLPRSFLAK